MDSTYDELADRPVTNEAPELAEDTASAAPETVDLGAQPLKVTEVTGITLDDEGDAEVAFGVPIASVVSVLTIGTVVWTAVVADSGSVTVRLSGGLKGQQYTVRVAHV